MKKKLKVKRDCVREGQKKSIWSRETYLSLKMKVTQPIECNAARTQVLMRGRTRKKQEIWLEAPNAVCFFFCCLLISHHRSSILVSLQQSVHTLFLQRFYFYF